LKEVIIDLTDYNASHNISVSAEILSCGMHNQVSPKLEGAMQDGRSPVLSHTHRAPILWATPDIWAMSVILKRGFDGVSTQINFVFGRVACSIWVGRAISTKVISRPKGARIPRKKRAVP
jgi:hypothetical protein